MRTTIRKFIETFPQEKCFTEPKMSIKDLSYEEKFKASTQIRHMLSVKDNRIYFAEFGDSIHRCGDKFYVKSIPMNYIWISPTEMNVKCSGEAKRKFLNLCGITWFNELSNAIIYHFFTPSIIKSILIGTIYNQETFYKAVGRRIFKVNVPWKLLRKFLDDQRIYFNINDLKCFTKDLVKSLEVLVSIPYNDNTYIGPKQGLLHDVLQSAIKLHEVVDFTWSDARLRAEHARQTRELMERDLDKKERIPIYDYTDFEGAKLLNTEQEIFYEASNMHHCLYNCYYDKIKNHNYIAFHMFTPEDCTFSVRLNSSQTPILDQIYLKYDKRVQNSTEQVALQFIEKYKTQLKEMLTKKLEDDDDEWLEYF